MFINQPKLKFNLIAVTLLSVTSIAQAATPFTLYACRDKTGKMLYTNNGCRANTIEVYHRLISGSVKTSNVYNPAAVSSTVGTPSPVTTSAPTDTVFAKTSFWYTPIPNKVQLAMNTNELAKEFVRQKEKYYNNVKINVYDYAAPVHTVAANVAPVKVGFNNCQKKTFIDAKFTAMLSDVPIPSYALPSAGTDAEMAIYQPSTHSYWEMWKAKKDSVTGEWTACWGGKITDINLNDGIFTKGYGTTATGLPFIGGQVTAEELARGEVKHAIGIALVDTEAFWVVSWPANRSDGYNPTGAANRIAEGQRFRLDPTINVDALKMSRAGKIIAKAAQKYGFIVWDKAGSISIRAQNARTYTAIGKPDPYPALFENKPTYAVLDGFPWDSLQFLPKDYGKP